MKIITSSLSGIHHIAKQGDELRMVTILVQYDHYRDSSVGLLSNSPQYKSNRHLSSINSQEPTYRDRIRLIGVFENKIDPPLLA